MKETSPKGISTLAALAAMGWLLAAGGCARREGAIAEIGFHAGGFANPLAVQQRDAYPEAVGGRFVSLADFETEDFSQATLFTIVSAAAPTAPATPAAQTTQAATPAETLDEKLAEVLNPSATGSASLRARLESGQRLRFTPSSPWPLADYRLLSLALRVDRTRDDLRVRLLSLAPGGEPVETTGPPLLALPGWNTLTLALPGGGERGGRLSAVELEFEATEGPITIHLDDILLIDNRRRLDGPGAMSLFRDGLDYALIAPDSRTLATLAPGGDGLFRMAGLQPRLALTAPGEPPVAAETDHLAVMGPRRLAAAELLELNALRARLRSTWHFPPAPGAWLDTDVRRIVWDWCIYADGRVATSVRVNNIAGHDIAAVALAAPRPVLWSDGADAARRRMPWPDRAVASFCMLARLDGRDPATLHPDYARPARLEILAGEPIDSRDAVRTSDGEATETIGGGYDPAEACYLARARLGQCRLRIVPAATPLKRPVFKILGDFSGGLPAVSCNGLAVRELAAVPEGVVFVVNETLASPALIELSAPRSSASLRKRDARPTRPLGDQPSAMPHGLRRRLRSRQP